MKINKTEREFREEHTAALRAIWGDRFVLHERMEREVADTTIRVLGLEFKPEEPELPGDLEVVRSGPGVMIGRIGGTRWVDLTRVDRQYPMEEAEMRHLEAIVQAANRLSEPESLARELYSDLKLHHEMREAGECASGRCPTCELLSRAKETLR